jgi:hypothetical protein
MSSGKLKASLDDSSEHEARTSPMIIIAKWPILLPTCFMPFIVYSFGIYSDTPKSPRP